MRQRLDRQYGIEVIPHYDVSTRQESVDTRRTLILPVIASTVSPPFYEIPSKQKKKETDYYD